MAVLKSLFRTRNRFVQCVKDFPLDTRWRWTAHPCVITGVVLVCLASLGVGYAGQQSGGSAASSAHAVQPAPSPQTIEWVNEGSSQLGRKDFTAAESDFRKAIQSDPSFAPAHRGLGIALWQQGKLGAAWTELGEVARLEPKSARAHYELGQLAWQIYSAPSGTAAASAGLSPGYFKSLALSQIEKAVSLEPRDFSMRLDLSEVELEAGRKKQAQADALGAIQLASSAPERARAQVALARASFATGDELGAEAAYKKAIAEDPHSGSAYYGLGQIALFQRKPDAAEKYFSQAIQVSPDLAPAYAALAQLLVKGGRPMEALSMLKKAVAIDPEDWQSQYELAKLLLEAGNSAQARELFTKILAAQPDFLQAREQFALMRLREGDVQGAMSQAQTLLARNPQAPEGHRVLALAFWRERQAEASLAECAQVLNVHPHDVSMLALQALELWQTQRKRDARNVLREAARS
ncbi:MAG: tetratricopeptide repeat protein [Acidobacteriota bacterium]